MNIDKIYSSVESDVNNLIKNKSFDMSYLVNIFKNSMEVAEGFTAASGEDKKAAVMEVIEKVLQTLMTTGVIDEQLHNNLSIGVKFLGPTAINLACMAAKGLMEINLKECCKCNGCSKCKCVVF